MFKFIHSSDIHLDSPLLGLERYEGAPVDEIRGACRRAFENMVELAISEECAFVLISGDLFDSDWKDYNSGLFLSKQMSRLRESGIKAFIISGNHDAANHISKKLRMPDNVKIFSTHKAESSEVEEVGAIIHGRGFESRSVTEDMSGTYPDRVNGLFNIAMLHTSLDGREGHDNYAPCSLQGLIGKGYDYWALGHVHKREIIYQDPWVVFSGNIQGRHIRETGIKGCTLVTVNEGAVVDVEHRELDVFRFCLCPVDLSGAATEDEVSEKVIKAVELDMDRNPDKSIALRLRLTGNTTMHNELQRNREKWLNEFRAALTDRSGETIWIEKVEHETADDTGVEDTACLSGDALRQIICSIDDLKNDDQFLDTLVNEFSNLNIKLPDELRNGLEGIDLSDKKTFVEAAEDVKSMILAGIQAGREAK